jgi:hypothetical protein
VLVARRSIIRWAALGVYAVVFVWWSATRGLPLDRERLFAWIIAAMLVAAVGRPWRQAVRVLVDWLPLPLFLVAYDFSRGAADGLGMHVFMTPQLDADRVLFFGEVPTVWLQQHLDSAGDQPQYWWEAIVALVYTSHFVLPLLVAGWLYWRDRTAWRKYVNRWLVLSFGAVLFFCLAPTAPPWMAASEGKLPPVERIANRGWSQLNLEVASRWIDKAQHGDVANLVAAVPSLHAGYATLIAVFFWPRVRRRLRPLLLIHPALMLFTIVWGGEHYVSDALAAYAFIALSYVVCNRAEARWARWRAERAPRERRTRAGDAEPALAYARAPADP